MVLQITIAVEPVRLGVGAELAFVPRGQFHRQRWQHQRLASAPPQAGAQVHRRVVRRQCEARRGDVVPRVESVVPGHAQDGVERNALVGIEAMVNARTGLRSVPGERFLPPVFPAPQFRVGVRETAARQTDREVRVRTERLANAEFGIDVNGRDRQAQGQVGLDKARLV